MVERITVSRNEVLHYPWLDRTWVYVHYDKTSIVKESIFKDLLRMLFKRGIREVIGRKFEGIIIEDDYIFIKYDTDEIIEIIKKACDWVFASDLTVKDPTSPKGKFFLENRSKIYLFLEETKKILEEKTYKYFYQCVDGMN